MTPDPATARLEALIASHDVVLFMKGDRRRPQCGFSATVVQILDGWLDDYATVDVLADPELRQGIKAFSRWPTLPQLFVRGEFVGGCDIVRELHEEGELAAKLWVARGALETPNLRVSEAAAEALRQALGPDPQRVLHLRIGPEFENALYVGPPEAGTVTVEASGVHLHLDPATARRARGLALELVPTPEGPAFRIDNPNAPPRVRELAPRELAQLRAEGVPHRLVDVRPPEERDRARIEGATPLDEDGVRSLQDLERDTLLVFHCHHGVRSQAAAEHFAQLGFRNVASLAGGIDAWSRDVDPSVPTY